MTLSLPSTEKLLGEFLRDKPYTQKGMWDAAERYQDYVRKYELGDVEILSFPQEIGNPHSAQYPLIKVISQFGTIAKPLQTWLGHMDVVEPDEEHTKHDSLIIKNINDEHAGQRMRGYGRGAIDMWGGNIAKLQALEIMKHTGNTRWSVQTVLSTLEEGSSTILWQAIAQKKIEAAKIGATTEILVGDPGHNSPVYCARTGRVGLEVTIKGEALHAGAADRHPDLIHKTAARYIGRALDEGLDEERGFIVANKHPEDEWNLLPTFCRAHPASIHGRARGLSVLSEVKLQYNVFPSDPNLAPETIRTAFEEYLMKNAKLQEELPTDESKLVNVHLERRPIPFIDPYLVSPEDPWIQAALENAKLAVKNVQLKGASGVAEDGMMFHKMGTKFAGWAPDGADAHANEWVDIASIQTRAEWLAKMAMYEGTAE